MTLSPTTFLKAAVESDAPLLANLLELYVHDLSGVFPAVELGADGRFGYPTLPLYWSEPERRFPFLILDQSRTAGFVLATRGSPVSTDSQTLDIAEFFILRQKRRTGVGARAAIQLWNQLRGRWTVRASEGNLAAVSFWTTVVAEYIGNSAVVSKHPGHPHPIRVFSFETPTQMLRTRPRRES